MLLWVVRIGTARVVNVERVQHFMGKEAHRIAICPSIDEGVGAAVFLNLLRRINSAAVQSRHIPNGDEATTGIVAEVEGILRDHGGVGFVIIGARLREIDAPPRRIFGIAEIGQVLRSLARGDPVFDNCASDIGGAIRLINEKVVGVLRALRRISEHSLIKCQVMLSRSNVRRFAQQHKIFVVCDLLGATSAGSKRAGKRRQDGD